MPKIIHAILSAFRMNIIIGTMIRENSSPFAAAKAPQLRLHTAKIIPAITYGISSAAGCMIFSAHFSVSVTRMEASSFCLFFRRTGLRSFRSYPICHIITLLFRKKSPGFPPAVSFGVHNIFMSLLRYIGLPRHSGTVRSVFRFLSVSKRFHPARRTRRHIRIRVGVFAANNGFFSPFWAITSC